MTRKKIAYYPGKPGPAPTGLKRTIPLMIMFNDDEWEFLNRLEDRLTNISKRSFKKAQIIRNRLFRYGWKKELTEMRRDQGANLP